MLISLLKMIRNFRLRNDLDQYFGSMDFYIRIDTNYQIIISTDGKNKESRGMQAEKNI